MPIQKAPIRKAQPQEGSKKSRKTTQPVELAAFNEKVVSAKGWGEKSSQPKSPSRPKTSASIKVPSIKGNGRARSVAGLSSLSQSPTELSPGSSLAVLPKTSSARSRKPVKALSLSSESPSAPKSVSAKQSAGKPLVIKQSSAKQSNVGGWVKEEPKKASASQTNGRKALNRESPLAPETTSSKASARKTSTTKSPSVKSPTANSQRKRGSSRRATAELRSQ